ncbi:MAG TPA: helix-turn-helix transcriptional regulator [Candidatus Angelobacter sp.]|jgi:transcriptional regulator with XRE-family HTH domain|nr:helix-turn-helix transcriptional regulator [Candidatus Angelobacter sp.]
MSRDIVVRFGRRIQGIRNAKNINQTILAEKVGTDQATISRVENGKQEPCLRFIELLAMGLKTPLDELFKDL